MKLTSRKTYAFIEISVDEIETTVFKSSEKEIKEMIKNLLDIADDLAGYINKEVKDFVDYQQPDVAVSLPVGRDELISLLEDKRFYMSNLPTDIYYLSLKETADCLLDNYIIKKRQ